MSQPPFSWLWGDPAEMMDRLRDTRKQFEEADRRATETERKRNRRRIRKLVKQARARQLKGQR